MSEPYLCPHCEKPVEIFVTDGVTDLTCPSCARPFSLPDICTGGAEANADDHFLDARRVHLLSARKRALVRQRSYLIIGIGGLVAVAGFLGVRVASTLWRGAPAGAGQVAFLLVAAAALVAASQLWSSYRRLSQELNTPALPEPEVPPDFSTLSDGSQRWRNLEEIR